MLNNEAQIKKLREEHQSELTRLKADYETRISELKREADELRQQVERDLTELDRSSSPDDSTVSYDLGRKLKEQVRLTQVLDSRLLENIAKNQNGASSETAAALETSNKIKQILDKLDTEGVMILSLSELLQLRAHLSQKALQSNPNMMNKALNATFDNEKQQLQKQIYQMRELLAKINEVCDLKENYNKTFFCLFLKLFCRIILIAVEKIGVLRLSEQWRMFLSKSKKPL